MSLLRSLLLLPVPLVLLLACGSSSSDSADKGAGSEACGFDADFCAAAGKNCGSFGLVDKCGATRTVECGDCQSPQSCGGGGSVNVCGASCDEGCPASFACNASGVCAGGSAHGVALDVKSVTVAGKVTLDGASLGVGAHCTNAPTDTKLRLSFEGPTSGASFSTDVLCDGSDTFSLALEPGTYRVSASTIYADTSGVPDGTFVVDPAFAVKGDVGGASFDIKTATLSGSVTLDGAPLGVGTHCTNAPTDTKVRISLVEATTGASFSADVLCGDATDGFSARVGAGSYRAIVSSIYDQTSNLPSGTFAAAAPITAGAAPVKIELKTASLSGKLTLNGGPLGTGAHCTNAPTDTKVRLSFADLTAGSSFSADVVCGDAASADDSFSLRIAPGTYSVSASSIYSASSNLPDGTFVVADSFTVGPTTAPAAFDARTTTLAGKLTLNGGPLGTGAHCTNAPTDTKVRLSFTETTTHASFSADVLCGAPNETDDAFSLTLAPGTYAVEASSIYSGSSSFPDGSFVVTTSLAVPAGGAPPAALDLRTMPVDGRLTLNGGPLGTGAHCTNAPTDTKVRLTFIDASSTPTFSIFDYWKLPPATSVSTDVLCGGADSFALVLQPGVYRVLATSIYSAASSLPDGDFTSVGRIDLH